MNIRQRSRGLVRTDQINLNVNLIDQTKKTPVEDLNSPSNFAKSSASLARDRKAAKKLFIFVFVFVICWFPYTLSTLIRALCKYEDKCISSRTYEFVFWLLWLNSTINPLLYSFLHVKFRKAFYEILSCSKIDQR